LGDTRLPPLRWELPAPVQRWRHYANAPLADALRRKLALHVRADLERNLPGPWLPSTIVVLPALPLTVNGKLDERALPSGHDEREGTHSAPGTPDEKVLCELVADLLGVRQAGLTDHFFHLGGDSIDSIRLVARARPRGFSFTPRDV